MSSSPINIPGIPSLPKMGYYDSNSDGISNNKENDANYTSYTRLTRNLTNSCANNLSGKSLHNSSGIYNSNNPNIKNFLPNGSNTNSLDIPYYLAKSGVLINNPLSQTNNLDSAVKNSCSANQQNIVNQIQYLTCQLESARNRVYESSKFSLTGGGDLKSIFEKFKNLKIFLIIIFVLSIYLGLTGFFGSIDLGPNIFNAIESNSKFNLSYWIGLLLGLSIPIIVLCTVLSKEICANLNNLEKYEITNNAYGNDKKNVSSSAKNFDILTLVLFIFLIYGFVAVLFTIKKNAFSGIIYTVLIGSILFIIAVFIYVLYAFIPFFNTTDPDNMMKTDARPLRLFIDNQKDVSTIHSNQVEDGRLRKGFFITFIVIFILAIIFFILKSSNAFLNGLLGSSAILILPILWVFNFILIIKYFYIYPIFLIIMRFFRYIFMSIIYIMYEKNSSLKDRFSEDLINQLENFKNYTPTWGLVGIDEFKLLLNVFGYENIFSKKIIPDSNNSKNITNNKFVSSGTIFAFLFALKDSGNKRGIIYSAILLGLTLIICSIILFGIIKVQKN